jgi:predicted Zn-dependent protease
MPETPAVAVVPVTERLAQLLKDVPADEAELVQLDTTRRLTRFAENIIHQNVSIADRTIYARCVVGQKVGVATTSDASADSIRRVLSTAAELARTLQPDPDFPGLPAAGTETTSPSLGFDPATADCDADIRSDGASIVAAGAHGEGAEAAGIFETASEEVYVANSKGLAREGRVTTAELAVTVSLADGRSGWAQAVSRRVDEIDPHRVARASLARAVILPETPTTLETGNYTVLLEPAAVGQLLLFLGFMGFGARTVAQQRSFLKKGEKITSESVTLREAPFAPGLYGLPVDYEGSVRQPVTLIERGVAGDPVSNSYYAAVTGGRSTGHALPPDNSYGPYPKHLLFEPSTTTRADLLRGIERGILITHFWYVNFLNPMRTMVTGTTRDGTFLVEKGDVTARVVDMRMEQSILEALSNVRAVGSQTEIYRQYSVMMSVPAIVVDNFHLVREG